MVMIFIFSLLQQLFDSLCVMFHEEYLVLKTVESTHLSSCESIKDEANRVTVVIEKFLPLFQKSKVCIIYSGSFSLSSLSSVFFLFSFSFCQCSLLPAFYTFGNLLQDKLDNYLLGSDKIVAVVAPSLPPLLISKEMEQLVLENFQILREFEEHLRAFFYHDLDRRSVTEALFYKFDETFKKVWFMVYSNCCLLVSWLRVFGPFDFFKPLINKLLP